MSNDHKLEETPRPPNFLLNMYLPNWDPVQGPKLSIYTGDEEIPTPITRDTSRPFVTLTFAQSLDAKIAGRGGKQLALSGKESLIMTHWMRTMHDAIMVGIGTALNDDPQLNTRHLPPLPENYPHSYHLPRPVIVDTHLRLPLDCKLLRNYKEGHGRRPWVFGVTPTEDPHGMVAWQERREALESAGAAVLVVSAADDGHISIPALLAKMRELEIRSVMVEGGAKIIQSFLAHVKRPEASQNSRMIDAIVVTVAPTFVGTDGVGYGHNISAEQASHIQHVHSELFGRDVVAVMKVS